ncbi:HAD family hydrolase [Actinoplanes sp. NPDC049118]|uniref:HAD family hydrolase n=1 Tax=Actinoplanes sp. NPDC049118 TaxID=3155769 RepID=UPI0033E7DB98
MTLADLVGRARCLLIDFDGPVCAVFAGHPAATVAAHLHGIIRAELAEAVPPQLGAQNTDPLQILRQVADLGDDALTRTLADACRDAEVTAVATATPASGADDVIRAAHESGRRVVIVSNNAAAAIEAYLRSHDLTRHVHAIAARHDGMDPRLLKPHPYLVTQGITAAHAQPANTAFIGDSVSDIEAGQAAGIATIGYANKPGKHQRLRDAGADTVIDTMHEVVTAVHNVATSPAT